MKTFVELIEEVRKSIDQEDNKILSAIEDNIELTSTATLPHAVGTYLVLDKVVYKVTTAITTGDTIEEGVNVTVADDIMTMIEALETENQTLTNRVKDMNNVLGSKNVLIHDLNSVYKLWQKEYTNRGSWSGRAWTYVGVTYTFNEDGSVTLSGTSTGSPINMKLAYLEGLSDGATYILSNKGSTVQEQLKLEIDGTEVTSLTGNDTYEFVYDSTKKYRISLKCIVTGTTHDSTVYPMLCLKSIYELDPTYVPPSKTNQQLTEDTTALLDNTEVNGAVNMLDSAIATQTKNDITVTNNGDGSYTVNCSSTEHNSANFISTKKVTLPKGTYKWTASADGKSPIGSNDCYAFIRGVNGTNDWYRSYPYSYGYGIITLTQESEIEFGLTVATNATVSNLTFKPMITLASYNGDYVPYAKSNKELTEDVTPEYFDLSVRGDRCTILAQKNCKVGKQVFIWCAITYTQTIANAPVLTVPSGYCPQSVVGTNYGIPINIIDSSSPSDHTVARYARVYSSGELDIYNVEQNKTYVVSGCYIID